MAVSTSSMAVVGGLQSQIHIQKSNLWSSSEPVIKYCPVILPPVRKTRGSGKWSAPTCTLHINRPSEAPGSPGKSSKNTRTGTVVVPEKLQTPNNCKGWTDVMGMQDQRLTAQFNALAALASDRTEMHAILAKQRDNWNVLFHTTITVASVSAAAAAAMNGAEQALGLSVVSTILGLGVAGLMAALNKIQPSQLAEEQRHASRFFKRLMADIEGTLDTDFRLREEASHYWEQNVATLHALDRAFPCPLTPVVPEKFPKVVRPSIISGPSVDLATPRVSISPGQSSNGWTSGAEKDLERTSQLLHTSDIPAYVEMATGVNHLNKILAITSPLLAAAGALCNMVDAMSGLHLSSLGAALLIGGLFVDSLSNAVQLGAAYETYRNCAGYYADVERSIERTLRLPVHQREDGMLFQTKIALQLGRNPTQSSMVPLKEEKAGTLF